MKLISRLLIIVLSILLFASTASADVWKNYGELASGNIADSDDFLIRDVSDTSLAPTGTQKRYTWLSLKTDFMTAFPGFDINTGTKVITLESGYVLNVGPFTVTDNVFIRPANGVGKYVTFDAYDTDTSTSTPLFYLVSGSTPYGYLGGITNGFRWDSVGNFTFIGSASLTTGTVTVTDASAIRSPNGVDNYFTLDAFATGTSTQTPLFYLVSGVTPYGYLGSIANGLRWTSTGVMTLQGTATIGGVNATTFGYLDPTSSVQGQLNGKAATTQKLDDFGTPDDNTDLNVTTTYHGLCPKLSNDAATWLDGTGAYSTPTAGEVGAATTSTKLDDFGTPDDNTDLNVTTTYHGLCPKLSNDAATWLDGTGVYSAPTAAEVGAATTATKLDDFGTPDDNTDLNATTGHHGLLPKLDDNAAHFLDGDGAWGTPTYATRDSLGLDTDDSPQFGAIELGHANDTTLARSAAGVMSVEGAVVQTTVQFIATVNPQDVYDNDTTNHRLVLCPRLPAAFTITRLYVQCDADPATEPTLTFYFATAGLGETSESTIEAVTTTAGVADVTSGIDDSAGASGEKIYVEFSDPDDALVYITLMVEGHY